MCYYGEHLYFANQDSPRILVATYDEHRARAEPDDARWGWFRPYGDRGFAVEPGDILQETEVPTANGVYYRVDVAMQFLERHGINPLPPWPKYPRNESGWSPYGSMDNYCERVAYLSEQSPLARAVSVIRSAQTSEGPLGRAFATLAELTGASPPHAWQAAHAQARAWLRRALIEWPGELRAMIDSALPPVLPVPARAPDEGEHEGDVVADRAIWQLRLLYSLVLGVHQKRLG